MKSLQAILLGTAILFPFSTGCVRQTPKKVEQKTEEKKEETFQEFKGKEVYRLQTGEERVEVKTKTTQIDADDVFLVRKDSKNSFERPVETRVTPGTKINLPEGTYELWVKNQGYYTPIGTITPEDLTLKPVPEGRKLKAQQETAVKEKEVKQPLEKKVESYDVYQKQLEEIRQQLQTYQREHVSQDELKRKVEDAKTQIRQIVTQEFEKRDKEINPKKLEELVEKEVKDRLTKISLEPFEGKEVYYLEGGIYSTSIKADNCIVPLTNQINAIGNIYLVKKSSANKFAHPLGLKRDVTGNYNLPTGTYEVWINNEGFYYQVDTIVARDLPELENEYLIISSKKINEMMSAPIGPQPEIILAPPSVKGPELNAPIPPIPPKPVPQN